MRNHFEATSQSSLTEMQEIKEAFSQVAESLGSTFELHRAEEKPNVLLSESPFLARLFLFLGSSVCYFPCLRLRLVAARSEVIASYCAALRPYLVL